jgi:anti-anti-sigma factor
MKLEISDIDARNARLSVQGRLDTPGVDVIETRFVASATTAAKNILVDLTAVPILTSMGIRMLISTARAIHNKKYRMIIFGAQGIVMETLDHVSLNDVIPVVATEAQALALLA